MKKPAHILSYRAERDMEGIWDYTAVHWNVEQADRYVRQLNAAMELPRNNLIMVGFTSMPPTRITAFPQAHT